MDDSESVRGKKTKKARLRAYALKSGFDRDRLKRLIDARGFTQKAIADHMGQYLSAFRRGLTDVSGFHYLELDELVRVLGVDFDAVDNQRTPRWICFPVSDLAELRRFHAAYAAAKRVITVSNALDSYLQDDWMVEWTNRDYLATPNWAEHVRGFLPYVEQQRDARRRSNFVHVHASPLALFDAAVDFDGEWIYQLSDRLGDYADMTVLSPIESFDSFHSWISSRLPYELRRWTKICIVDDLVALVHHPDRLYFQCFHQETVKHLADVLEGAIAAHSGVPIPPRDDASLTDVREAAYAGNAAVEVVLERRVRRLRKARGMDSLPKRPMPKG